MRVMVSPLLLKAYEDLGASPTPVPFGEVYGALQLGQVDGQINPIPTIEEMKFYEVSDYLIWAGEQELATAVMDGDQLRLTLVWQAEAEMPLAYTAFVHVLDADGQMIAQLDRQPAGYPTTDWRPGEVVVDTYEIALPEGATLGDYEIEVGLYLAETGRRLGVTRDGEAAGDAVQLTPLSVD